MSIGLKQAKTDPKEIDIRVKEAADILQITDYLDRSPKKLIRRSKATSSYR